MDKVLGIDIGGTSIKVGVFSLEGKLESLSQIPTGDITTKEAYAEIVEGLTKALAECGASRYDVVAVGLDVPGPVDDCGQVGMLPNIALNPTGLLGALTNAFPDAELSFVNDANAAALGELWQGSAKGLRSFVLVALGTGCGGGVVVNGRLVPGAFGAGGEIGHITVNRDEELTCGCGRKGCLEQYASAMGLVRMYREECARLGSTPTELEHDTDTLSIFKALEAGDEAAKSAVHKFADYLGYALAQISAIVDPECYLIAGGISGGWDLFKDDLRDAFRRYCLWPSTNCTIRRATLGGEAGTYGSAYSAYALMQLRHH